MKIRVRSFVLTTMTLALAAGASLSRAQPAGGKRPAAQPTAKPADAGKPAAAKADAKGAQPGGDDLQKKVQESMTPGPQHAQLAKTAGDFTTATRWRIGASQPWMEFTGTSKRTMIMGGRFVQEDADGSMQMPGPDGKPTKTEFKGMGIFGYNNVSKRYEGSWMGNMGTGVMQMTGRSSDDGTTVEWNGTCDDPITGTPVVMRMVATQKNDDHALVEFYRPGQDGKEFKTMEVAYTRTKEAAANSSR
jgi:hypothetical protein